MAREGQMIPVENPQGFYQLIQEALTASGPGDKTWKEKDSPFSAQPLAR